MTATVINYKAENNTETVKAMAAIIADTLKSYGNRDIKNYLESNGAGDWTWYNIKTYVTPKCFERIQKLLSKKYPLFLEGMQTFLTVGSTADYMDNHRESNPDSKAKNTPLRTVITHSDVYAEHLETAIEDGYSSLFDSLMTSMQNKGCQKLYRYLKDTPFENWKLSKIKEKASNTAFRSYKNKLQSLFKKELGESNTIPDDMETYILHWLEKDVIAPTEKEESSDDFEVPEFEVEEVIEKEIVPKVKITPYSLSGVCEVFVALPNGVVGGKFSEVMPGNGEIVKNLIVNWADRRAAEIYIGQAIPRSKVEVFYSYYLAKNFYDAQLMTSANEAMEMLSTFFRQCDDSGEMGLVRDRLHNMLENV